MTNISQIMKQAKAMQEKMAEAQKKLKKLKLREVQVVLSIMDGKYNLKKINIDPNLVDKDEVEVLEDLVVAAYDASKKSSGKHEQSAWSYFF